jgi:hypothetical protein
MRLIFFLLLIFRFGFTQHSIPSATTEGLYFHFKGIKYHLTEKMKSGAPVFGPHASKCNNACLDSLCNRLIVRKNYVEIIRQNHSIHPEIGLALGFEFDPSNGEYPYTPAYAVAQFKDFRWGGIEFSQQDTCNFTGLSNRVSDDLQIEVDSFARDTIFGRFSGLLLSGAGPMASIDSGFFCIRLYRQED